MELRQTLVALGMNKRRASVSIDMPTIKHKALFTNLLISRDAESLEAKLAELQAEKSDLLYSAECSAAEQFITDFKHTSSLVEAALDSCTLDTLDQTLALCAYHFYAVDEVTQLVAELNAISDNPAVLLKPVVEALRLNDMSNIEGAFKLIDKVGWVHSAVDAVICAKIHDRQNKIVQVIFFFFLLPYFPLFYFLFCVTFSCYYFFHG